MLANLCHVRYKVHINYSEFDEAKIWAEKYLRIKKQYLCEHHPEIVTGYFMLFKCLSWERGNFDKQKQSMLFNEKALDLLKEQFDINDSENEDSLTYLKVAKTQVNHFMYLARIFKREEAYE